MGFFDFLKNNNTNPSTDSAPSDVAENSYIEEIETHIEKHIGKIAYLLHEIVSDKIHLDVHVVTPTENRPFYTLVTSGMSSLPMNIPEGLDKKFVRAEVMINLPANWKIDDLGTGVKYSKDEANWWPIRLLKSVASTPIDNNTWVGLYHTVSNNAENTPYDSSTNLCSAMITFPYSAGPDFMQLQIDKDTTIMFYEIYPIYKEELQYKIAHSGEELDALLQKHEIPLIMTPDRLNAVLLENK